VGGCLKELLADLSSTERAEAMKGLRGRMAEVARDSKSPFGLPAPCSEATKANLRTVRLVAIPRATRCHATNVARRRRLTILSLTAANK
jgi:hypothetical protein